MIPQILIQQVSISAVRRSLDEKIRMGPPSPWGKDQAVFRPTFNGQTLGEGLRWDDAIRLLMARVDEFDALMVPEGL